MPRSGRSRLAISLTQCVAFFPQIRFPAKLKRVLILLMSSLAQFSCGTAAADPPVVTGYTSADNKSVEGIRNMLVLLVCPELQSIVAQSPPDGFDPKGTPELPATFVKRPVGPIRFEQWTVEPFGKLVLAHFSWLHNADHPGLHNADR